MSTTLAALRMIEVSGAEALWLLEGSALGRLVLVQREQAVVRPARHVWQYGRLIVRAPAQAVAVPATVAYHVDEVRAATGTGTGTGTGWTVTAAGPAEVTTDADEAAHHRRTLAGWTHGPCGPHDTVSSMRPQTVTGFRLAQGTER